MSERICIEIALTLISVLGVVLWGRSGHPYATMMVLACVLNWIVASVLTFTCMVQ